MIWGVFYKDPAHPASKTELDAMAAESAGKSFSQHGMRGNFGFGMKAQFAHECDMTGGAVSVIFQGSLVHAGALCASLNVKEPMNPAALLVAVYSKWGESFIETIDGKFAFCLADQRTGLFLLGRDRFGMESLFYFEDDEKVVFGTGLKHVVRHPGVPKGIDFEAVHQFLLFCYNPTNASFYKKIRKLPQSHMMVFRNGSTIVKPYWKLTFAITSSRSENELSDELLPMLDQSVQACLDPKRKTGIFLSGGMDSSSVVALACRKARQPIQTFSYRCRGESFDESRYAKIVSDFFRTQHHLVEYTPETIGTMGELVRFMDEPFCDVGINLATDILGREAAGKIDCVLTGDGGDELFGGHPVYLADRAAVFFDRIPSFLKIPFYAVGEHLHDSEQKKNWKVKWKRFARSVRFPQTLFSHRWRIYYTPGEIDRLLSPDLRSPIRRADPYREMFRLHEEADGKDLLSLSIFSDYHTVVGFYLRRMDLIRRFGIEPRFPFFDRRLVEFCATIPPHLKIRNGSDVKTILKRSMQNVLPEEIVFRKDKLGHSIPLKNWMRDQPVVREWMMDLLSESSLAKRSYFNPKTVETMINEHMAKRENHSHRLWALMVLELWFRENID